MLYYPVQPGEIVKGCMRTVSRGRQRKCRLQFLLWSCRSGAMRNEWGKTPLFPLLVQTGFCTYLIHMEKIKGAFRWKVDEWKGSKRTWRGLWEEEFARMQDGGEGRLWCVLKRFFWGKADGAKHEWPENLELNDGICHKKNESFGFYGALVKVDCAWSTEVGTVCL